MSHHQFCLKWKNHSNNLLNVFDRLFSNENFTDITLVAEGRSIRAHKMVLSSCSAYFEKLFLEHHAESACFQRPMIVVMRETSFEDLSFIIEFMYKGEINISRDQLGSLLKTAESLRVKGLAQATQDKKTNGDIDPFSKVTPSCQTSSEITSTPTALPSQAQTSTTSISPKDRVKSMSRKRRRIRPKLESINDRDDSASLLDHSQTSSPTFTPRIENVVSMESQRKSPVSNNDDSVPVTPRFTETISTVAESLEPSLPGQDSTQHLQDMSTASNSESDQQPKVKQEQCDESFRFFRGFSVYKFNDYITHCQGTRQQYWEEPFTQAVLNGIQDRELDMRKGAQLLGVSYSTLYGRYKYIQT